MILHTIHAVTNNYSTIPVPVTKSGALQKPPPPLPRFLTYPGFALYPRKEACWYWD